MGGLYQIAETNEITVEQGEEDEDFGTVVRVFLRKKLIKKKMHGDIPRFLKLLDFQIILYFLLTLQL
jgi:hypothetical protein